MLDENRNKLQEAAARRLQLGQTSPDEFVAGYPVTPMIQQTTNTVSNYTAKPPVQVPAKVLAHADICRKLTQVYDRKNHDYGDSFGKQIEEYGLTSAAIRLEDKMNRFKKLIKAEALVKDESIKDTLEDMANYAIMTLIEMEAQNINQ